MNLGALVEVKGGFDTNPPKSNASRRKTVLPGFAVTALQSHRRQTPVRGPDALVFATRNGTPLRKSNILRRHFTFTR